MKLIVQSQIKFNSKQKAKINSLGFTIKHYFGEKITGDVYLGYPQLPFSELENIEGLKFVQSLMAGYDHLDMDYIKSLNIMYANASGISSIPISEFVILKLLEHYKNAEKFRLLQRKKKWKSLSENSQGVQELYGRQALILGSGSVGSEVAKRLKVFGVSTIGINRSGKSVEHFDQTYTLSEVYDHLPKVDIVIGALPLSSETLGIYDKKFFKLMPKDGVFVNVGRGPQLNEKDLLEIIDDHLSYVYLDVLPNEPLSKDSKLWDHKKISITPHISFTSDKVLSRSIELAIENLKRFRENREIINRVV